MKRLIVLLLAAVLMLAGGCHRPAETPEKPASSTIATAENPQPVTVTGEWRVSLPVAELVDAAANHSDTLRPLGQSNVSLLRTAEPYVAPLDTEATLEAVLTLKEDKTGRLLIPRDAMKTTSLAVVAEYSPLLKNIVAPVVEDLLPSDISVSVTYELVNDKLTLTAAADPDTAVVLQAEERALTVTGVVSRTLSEPDRSALERLLKKADVRRG